MDLITSITVLLSKLFYNCFYSNGDWDFFLMNWQLKRRYWKRNKLLCVFKVDIDINLVVSLDGGIMNQLSKLNHQLITLKLAFWKKFAIILEFNRQFKCLLKRLIILFAWTLWADFKCICVHLIETSLSSTWFS